jgi:NlpC/P60 family putative phage cell wall peptidase
MTDIHRPDVALAALDWIGTPYLHQQSKRQLGCDCLGLVRGVWRDVVGAEPVSAPAYARDADEVEGAGKLAAVLAEWFIPIEAPVDGAVLLFRWHRTLPPKHLGIVLKVGNDGLVEFAHAQNEIGVCRGRLDRFWQKRLVSVFRFPTTDELAIMKEAH